jgi:D-lyxose ketol-isomerase
MGGPVECSQVNDDCVDIRFHDVIGRFPDNEEDEALSYLLGKEYPS